MGSKELHILLADDTAVNRKVLQHMVARLGHRVDEAKTGQEAVEKASSVPYDLIFMDMMMPIMDGLDATRQIRENESGARRTPIVAVTANVERSDERACVQAGMDTFLTKPFTLDQVRSTIDRFSSHRFNVSDKGGLDASMLNTFIETLGADDVDFAIEVLGDLLTEGNRVRVSIQNALDQDDARETAMQAHSLKSAAAVVGAQELATICRSIEDAAKKGNLDDVRLMHSRFEGALNLVRQDVEAFRNRHSAASRV